ESTMNCAAAACIRAFFARPRPPWFSWQTSHATGKYFAARGYAFLTVDVRGRGDSGGTFTPMLQEAKDGFDVVEWLARQPYWPSKPGWLCTHLMQIPPYRGH